MVYTIDAQGKRLGRLATEVATVLQGKHRPSYDPRLPGDDFVRVKNIDKVTVGPKKMTQKRYYRHTTQIGHLKERTLQMMWDKKPARPDGRSGGGPAWVLRHAIMGMLPKNRLRARRMKRLIIE